MPNKSKRLLQNLAVSTVAILLCCLAIELALRLIRPVQTFVNPLTSFHRFDPELGWLGSPNLTARFRKPEFEVLVRHNADGFRAKESAARPDPGSPVVAVLGDSFTWGWGVDNGKVFTDVMQNELGAAADVRNLGVNAYGTLQELLLLERSLTNGLRPQVVIVMLVRNDFYDNISAEDRKPWLAVTGTNATVRNLPVLKRGISPLNKFVKASHFLSAIAYMADFAREKRRVNDLEQATFKVEAIAEEPRRAMSFCLERLKARCASAGSRLRIVYAPGGTDFRSESTLAVQTAVKALCAETGVPLLDLSDDFRQAGHAADDLFFLHDRHWKVPGHDLVGKRLAAVLKEELSSASQAKP